MPVMLDSASSAAAHIGWGTTSGGTPAAVHNVSPAAENVVALVGLLWTGQVDTTGATFGATFGGTAMDTFGTAKRWNSNKSFFQWYILDGSLATADTVPSGPQTVLGSFSSMPTESLTGRAFMMVCATYSNVASVGTVVQATPSASTSNTVTVASVLPAHRVVSCHALGDIATGFSAFNHNIRASAYLNQAFFDAGSFFATGGALLMGDADGAASVVNTATQASTALWGASGVSLAPTTVVGAADLTVSLVTAAGGGTYRTATPDEQRYYVIPAIGTDDPNQIAGNFVQSADGVHMPVWIKDPNDIEDYSLDWSNIIVEDDEIISVKFSPTSSALSVFSVNIGDSLNSARTNVVTSCWFTGGVAGVNYGVVAHVTTAEGRQHDRTFRIVGGQK